MLEPGTQIGRYEVQRRLGRGGMGSVYGAHDPVLGRMVAIKVFASELEFPDARERFSREARSAAALTHPNIVTVYDFGEFASQPYIVMEYVPGETLAAVIRRKAPFSIADKLRWMDELCAGAGYAHQMSVVHRDIKPANLIIDRAGRLKILDFGIARVIGTASNTSGMIGTPGYMAPEQIEGRDVDCRADLFSIGVVFYELLAYAEAFAGDTAPTITYRILFEDPVPLTNLVDIDPAVGAVVDRALKKNVLERFGDAESMRAAIVNLRRQLEADDSWIRRGDMGRRDAPPAPAARGTGSVRRSSSDAAAVATPPPDPKRTDREELARLRAAYFEAALDSAQKLLLEQELHAALAACHQALTYDETHQGALALEQQIKSALMAGGGRLSVPSVVLEGPAAAPRDPRARSVEVALSGAGTSDVGLGAGTDAISAELDRTVLRPVSQNLVPPREHVPEPFGPTMIAPARRTPAPAPSAPTELRPRPTPGPPADSQRSKKAREWTFFLKRVRGDLRAKLKTVTATLPAIDFKQLKSRNTLIVAGIGVVMLVSAVALIRSAVGPPPTGRLILDATPWATVRAVVSEDGEPQPLPSPASTPLALSLRAGNYEVILVGPPPESGEQRITIRVDPEMAITAPLVRFRSMTPEDYFEQYLASPEATAVAVESAEPLGSPVPPAPPSAPANLDSGISQ